MLSRFPRQVRSEFLLCNTTTLSGNTLERAAVMFEEAGLSCACWRALGQGLFCALGEGHLHVG